MVRLTLLFPGETSPTFGSIACCIARQLNLIQFVYDQVKKTSTLPSERKVGGPEVKLRYDCAAHSELAPVMALSREPPELNHSG